MSHGEVRRAQVGGHQCSGQHFSHFSLSPFLSPIRAHYPHHLDAPSSVLPPFSCLPYLLHLLLRLHCRQQDQNQGGIHAFAAALTWTRMHLSGALLTFSAALPSPARYHAHYCTLTGVKKEGREGYLHVWMACLHSHYLTSTLSSFPGQCVIHHLQLHLLLTPSQVRRLPPSSYLQTLLPTSHLSLQLRWEEQVRGQQGIPPCLAFLLLLPLPSPPFLLAAAPVLLPSPGSGHSMPHLSSPSSPSPSLPRLQYPSTPPSLFPLPLFLPLPVGDEEGRCEVALTVQTAVSDRQSWAAEVRGVEQKTGSSHSLLGGRG
mmetsp:Transcript_47097/g.121705  ORF Transcript_47097/g.121705 Transcript_47097/m.121705 type:complete len:316 (+) Transcript_47097:611-1558(+)